MHIHARAWRRILGAVAIVALALPAVSPLATPASAAPASTPTPFIAGAGVATPGIAFNPLGTPHTVTFNCLSTTGIAEGAGPGCYDLVASVNDATGGAAPPFTSATCGTAPANVTSGTVNCSGFFSPLTGTSTCTDAALAAGFTFYAPLNICRLPIATTAVAGTSTTAALCVASTSAATPGFGGTVVAIGGASFCSLPAVQPATNRATVTINPGAPHDYFINFTFYTLVAATPAAGVDPCPGGTYRPDITTVHTDFGLTPLGAPVAAPFGVCQNTVSAEKKYVEITGIQLTGTGPCAAGAGTSTVMYSEGLKAFFGTPCTVTATATGTVILKTGVNCANGSEPANGSTIPSSVDGGRLTGTTARYSCVGDTLSIIGIPSTVFASGGLPITLTITGPLGPASGVVTFNGACAGTAASTISVTSGVPVTLCPSGVGSGTISGAFAGGGINTQPGGITGNTLTFTFAAPNAGRLVPTIRWAGEKAVLTKCFGGGGTFGGASVEFTLQGSTIANASLIPVTTPAAGGALGSTTTADQNTVWTVADASGCASVIVYARSEGIVNVDAAIFGTVTGGTGTGAPLLNEHAFTVYYLKFDHLDLENITFPGYASSTLASSLSFSTTAPAGFPSFGALPANFTLPNPPGTGQVAGAAPYAVQLCNSDFVRAMVHGYFEIPGDPSGRPATNVAIPGAPAGIATTATATTSNFQSVGSYVLPAGRWVLPDDWPVLATFAGFNGTAPIQNSTPGVQDPSSVLAWDLNSGWVFNPGSERADLGFGPSAAPAKVSTGAIPSTSVATGPFFGQDGNSQPYSTAPGTCPTGFAVAAGNTCTQAIAGTFTTTSCTTAGGTVSADLGTCTLISTATNCAGGLTVGIGPFDSTQACTNPFPLAFSPAGSGVLTSRPVLDAAGAPTGGLNFTFGALGPNSTYLPNATLNQWDAPMPPAQVSFGITAGPGFLGQVNKTGLYSILVPSSSSPTSGVCPAGTTGNATPATACSVAVYPDPFYAEAIPASPLIPPITNNGGYLWNSWNFSSGTVLGATTAGGFVPGESTTVAVGFGAATCPPGFTAGATGTCTSVSPSFTPVECTALGGTFTAGTTAGFGTCQILAPNPTTDTVGGLNTTNFGNCVDAFVNGVLSASPTVVTLQDATGFQAGMTVEVYSSTTGATRATNLTVASVVGNTVTFTADANTAAVPCILAGQGVFVAQQFGIVLPAGATTPATGSTVGLFFGGHSASATVFGSAAVGGTTYLFLNGAEAIARALGGCVLSRGPVGGPVAFGTCEPATIAPAGTLITTSAGATSTNAGGAITAAPSNPYPFWQWVPNPAAPAPARPTTATVYSDNHGEAVVSLQSGVATTVVPVANSAGVLTCPAGYDPAPTAAAPTTCILQFATLGTTAAPGFGPFANIVAATTAFNSTTPGCLNTTATGTTSTATGATALVGANGPAAGQICVNANGRLEFGLGATLGTTTIQAVADYPYTRGDHPAIGSATLTKVWTSAFQKSVSVVAAGTPATTGACAPANGTAGANGPAGTGICNYTVTVTANDLCGQPLTGEPVQVYAVGAAGSVVLAPVFGGTALSTSNASAVLGTGGAAPGTATFALEVLSSQLGTGGLLIKVVFPLEGIERFATVVQSTTPGQTVQVIYTPGYNMVGGPSNSNFGSAEAAFSYSSSTNAYSNVTASATSLSSAPPACTGYYAYFASATAVNLPATSQPGQTAACTLHAGWNLIGNPFASPATLPAGTTAYHWNGTAYDVVGAIPTGGAVYIFNGGTADVTLTLTAS